MIESVGSGLRLALCPTGPSIFVAYAPRGDRQEAVGLTIVWLLDYNPLDSRGVFVFQTDEFRFVTLAEAGDHASPEQTPAFLYLMRARTYTPKADGSKDGIVLEALPGLSFRVKVLPGDRVLVIMSSDGRRGRIVRRL
jgi:translation initiation factor IF-1